MSDDESRSSLDDFFSSKLTARFFTGAAMFNVFQYKSIDKVIGVFSLRKGESNQSEFAKSKLDKLVALDSIMASISNSWFLVIWIFILF